MARDVKLWLYIWLRNVVPMGIFNVLASFAILRNCHGGLPFFVMMYVIGILFSLPAGPWARCWFVRLCERSNTEP